MLGFQNIFTPNKTHPPTHPPPPPRLHTKEKKKEAADTVFLNLHALSNQSIYNYSVVASEMNILLELGITWKNNVWNTWMSTFRT